MSGSDAGSPPESRASRGSQLSRAEKLRRAIRLKKTAARPAKPALPRRPPERPARLGEMQHALWLAYRLAPTSSAYNLANAFRVRGSLDAERLEAAIGLVIAHHRILRSTFRPDGDEVIQVIHPPSPADFQVLKAGDLGAGRDEIATVTALAREPFDLENRPPVRVRLVHGDRESVLLLVLHHILADERSLKILWREIVDAYEGRSVLTGPSDSDDRPQYDDFVHWQHHRETSDAADTLAFWRSRLTPLPQVLHLPFERSAARSPVSTASPGRLLERPMNPTLRPRIRQAIRRLAADLGTTPFAIFAFAFRLLLHRYTEGQRVAFATPVSSRNHPAAASMIGYFSNPVAVYEAIDEGLAVEVALREFAERLRENLSHASLSFQTLVERLAPPRDPGRQPIVQSMFVYQEAAPPPRLGDARLEPLSLDLGASKFDLTLFVTEGDQTLDLAVEYRQDRFDEVWMWQLLDHFETLVEALPRDLGRAVAEVPMLRRDQIETLRAAAEGPRLHSVELGDRANNTPTLLPHLVFDRMTDHPTTTAITWGGGSWSYRELEDATRSLAGALTEAGVRPGDRVGIFLNRGARMIAAVLATHWVGAAYVPLDPAYPRARTRTVLDDAQVAAVLTERGTVDDLPAGAWAIVDTEDARPGERSFSNTFRTRLADGMPAYVLYTSGSTGRPKGVVVSHGNLRASTLARRQVYGVSPGRFLLVPSVAFDSSVAGLFWTLADAGTLVIPSEEEVRDPERLAALIAEERVTGLLCVPSLYRQLIHAGRDELKCLKFAIVAGESCPPKLVREHLQALPDTRLFNEYGPTEATVWATVAELTETDVSRTESEMETVAIGRPIPGVRLDLLDAMGRRVPAGIPGNAWIVGPTVAQGYWRRPGLTAERFAAHSVLGEDAVDQIEDGSTTNLKESRAYRTGDRMAWTPHGQLLFLGREDDQIKLRGFRIEPGEIEAALLQLDPRVEDAAVIARRVHAGGNLSSLSSLSSRSRTTGATGESADSELIAFVQVTAKPSSDERTENETTTGSVTIKSAADPEWRRRLAETLPSHMIPSLVVELVALPRLPNGKVDRRRLLDLPINPAAPSKPSESERQSEWQNPRERALLSLWEGLLGRFGLSRDDNFFELGGHSLLVVEMTRAIERDFEVRLASTDVFENPTVAELVQRMEQQGSPATAPYQHLFPLQTRGAATPFIIAVPHFFSEMLASHFRGERPVYGLRGVSLRPEGNRGRWQTMTHLGRDLVEEIRRRFPNQGLIVAGYSFGASMAFETVRLLEQEGIPVERLYLIAPMPLNTLRIGPFRLSIDGLRQPLESLSTAQALRLLVKTSHPLSLRPYRRIWRWLSVQPWRRFLCWIGKLRIRAGLPLTPRILHADVRVERFRLHSHYRPSPVRTPAVLFNPEETETDAAATWRPYFQGEFTVQPTPDPHLDEASAQAAREVIIQHLKNLGDD